MEKELLMVDSSDRASRLLKGKWSQSVRALVVFGFLASLGFGAIAWSGCGGGDQCQACRDDCTKNNIPLPDCNCKAQCPGT
jgi:hypothetical protein